MDMVTIRATVDVSGFPKGEKVTVAETARVAGAIRNGVFELIERHPAETSHDGETDPETDDETSHLSHGETLLGVSPPQDEVFCKCMGGNCTNRHYQDWLDEQAEVAADNSTVVPSHRPSTRKRRG